MMLLSPGSPLWAPQISTEVQALLHTRMGEGAEKAVQPFGPLWLSFQLWEFISVIIRCNEFISIPISKVISGSKKMHSFQLNLELIDWTYLFLHLSLPCGLQSRNLGALPIQTQPAPPQHHMPGWGWRSKTLIIAC